MKFRVFIGLVRVERWYFGARIFEHQILLMNQAAVRYEAFYLLHRSYDEL